jgi:hypothetical protein
LQAARAARRMLWGPGMRRIMLLALTALTITGGSALADRHHGGRGGHANNGRAGWSQRQTTRVHVNNVRVNNGRTNNARASRFRNYDRSRYRVVRVNRSRPAYRNGRFYFAGGFYRTYSRPVINVRYTNYYVRPRPIVENYAAVPGYIWIAGQWQWTGVEWNWVPGHYDIDTAYQDNYSDGSVYYDYGY